VFKLEFWNVCKGMIVYSFTYCTTDQFESVMITTKNPYDCMCCVPKHVGVFTTCE